MPDLTNEQICLAQRNKERLLRWAREWSNAPSFGKRMVAQASFPILESMPLEAFLGADERTKEVLSA